MPQFGWRSDTLVGDRVSRAYADGDSARFIDGFKPVFIGQVVADEDGAATAIRRLAQKRLDDLALAGCRREDLSHRFAELDPIFPAEALEGRMSGGDTEFLFVRSNPPMERHRTSF